LFPKHPPFPKGGRPRADDRECFEGILWLIRTGSRWQDIPVDFPSGSTCWRRLRDWAGDELLSEIHATLIEELDDLRAIDFEELFADATFIRAKNGYRRRQHQVGKGMKLEVVADASGLPLGMMTAAANVPETELLRPALDDVPVEIPRGTPVIADKDYDSDPLRDELVEDGYVPIFPHRRNRTKPSRNDGRRQRRYRRRWMIERTNAWLHCYRGLAVRWSHYSFLYDGMVYIAFIHMALQRF
jgi:transposase